MGLPGALGHVTIIVELLGGAALILGYQTRVVALALLPVLLGAVFFVHGQNGWLFSNEGGGWEFPVLWAVVNLAIAGLGAGAFALKIPNSSESTLNQTAS